jgi:hypothetical protein
MKEVKEVKEVEELLFMHDCETKKEQKKRIIPFGAN